MKLLAIIFIFIISVGSSYSQIKYDLAFPFEGFQRELIVSIPTSPPPAAGYPVVMMLHGTSGDKDVFYNSFGWKELGQKENFITVFPSALRWCYEDAIDGTIQTKKFVCGDLLEHICPKDEPNLISDVKFFKKIIQLLSDTVKIDPKRVFGTGFSNGSCTIQKTAMEAGDVFKACAGSSGIYHTLDSITPKVKVPIWFIVGVDDDRFIRSPFTALPYGGDSMLVYLKNVIMRTLVSQGLTSNFIKTETAITKTYLYKECLPGEVCAPYAFTIIKNMVHQYPNGINHPVNAPKLFWDFFNNPPTTMTSTTSKSTHVMEINCFPNPSTKDITIALNEATDFTYSLFNTLGQIVVKQTKLYGSTFVLERNNLKSGLYFLQVNVGEKKRVFRLVFF